MAENKIAVPAAEFRQKIVDLVRSGPNVKEFAEEFEPSEQTTRDWPAEADAEGGKRKGLRTSAEREELVKLRRENKQLKTEREILAKATTWLATKARRAWRSSSSSKVGTTRRGVILVSEESPRWSSSAVIQRIPSTRLPTGPHARLREKRPRVPVDNRL